MADGLCEKNQDSENIKMKTPFDISSAVNVDVISTNNKNSEQPELCVNGESGEVCSKFGVDSVLCVSSSQESGSGSGSTSSSSFTSEFNNICQDNDDNCRKKRCADRYDSSESSDSGVAVHGCSDCSVSLSSGNSDIADPGSPYSTSSDDSSTAAFRAVTIPTPTLVATPIGAAMPPVASPVKQAQGSVPLDSWTWSGSTDLVQPVSPPPDSFPAAPITASKCNKRGPTVDATDCKRLKPEQTLLCVQACQHNLKKAPVTKTAATAKPTKVEPREKITQYFKPQKQPDGRRLSTDKIAKETSDFVPFLSAIFSNKGSTPSVPAAPPDKMGTGTGTGLLSVKKDGGGKLARNAAAVSNGAKRDTNGVQVSKPKQPQPQQQKQDESDKQPGAVVALCTRLEEKPSSPKPCAEPEPTSMTSSNTSTTSVTAIEDRDRPRSRSPTDQTPTPTATERAPADRSQTPTDRPHSERAPSDRPHSDRAPSDRSETERTCSDRSPSQTSSDRSSSCVSDRTPSPEGAFLKTVINEEASDIRAPSAAVSASAAASASAADGLRKAVSEQLTVTPPECASVGPTSPILSLPKTIRFPVQRSDSNANVDNQSGVGVGGNVVTCQWTECALRFETSTALLEHLQVEHVNSQTQANMFVCLWTGCKVYGRSSCSRSWLEGHVLSHVGKKPFRCIVDGCGLRFSSQVMLERHVNWHFKQAEGGAGNGTGPRRSLDTTPNKLFRRNGKKLRYRRHPWSALRRQSGPPPAVEIKARVFDYFDTGVMEGLQHRLLQQAQQLAGGDVDRTPGSVLTLHSRVIGRKIDADGTCRVLVRWFPRDVAPDEWMVQKDVPTTRVTRLQCPDVEVDYSCPLVAPPLAGSTGSSPASSSCGTPSGSPSGTPTGTPAASRSDTPIDSCLDSEEDSSSSSRCPPPLPPPLFALMVQQRTSTPRVKQRRKPLKT